MTAYGSFDLKQLAADVRLATQQLPEISERASMNLMFSNDGLIADSDTSVLNRDIADIQVDSNNTEASNKLLDVIKRSLRGALQLEFTTVPLYLTALWSIIDQAHPVARSLRAVVHEEMLHLSLICNLLSALGERPVLTGSVVPRFPSQLPGGVHPELLLHLEGYGPSALQTFMEIERPERPIQIIGEPLESFPEEDTTIGEFYESILQAIKRLNPYLDPKRQIAGPFTWFVMTKVEHVEEAITLIMAQGEGARGMPFSQNSRYLSHYYRFKSLSMLTELHWDNRIKKLRKGAPIPSPSVFSIAPASPNGYGLAVPRALRSANERFEESYSKMLRLLEESWLEGGDKSFVQSLEIMLELGTLAQAIMRIGSPDGRGYCPSFLYRP